MKFTYLLLAAKAAAAEEVAAEQMDGIEKTTENAVAIMPMQHIQPQHSTEFRVHSASYVSMGRVLSALSVAPSSVTSARPVKSAAESKELIEKICVAAKKGHFGPQYVLLKNYICESYNLDALQDEFEKQNIILSSFTDWIEHILQLVLNTPDLRTSANLKATFQAIKIFYHRGAKFSGANLDLIKKNNHWLNIFKEVFDSEVPLICLRLGYDEILSIPEIARRVRSEPTYPRLLTRALLSFDKQKAPVGKAKRCFEILLDSGVNAATILKGFNELFVEKIFNKDHLFFLKIFFSLRKQLSYVPLEKEIENILANLIKLRFTEQTLKYCFREILSSELRGIASEVQNFDPALQSAAMKSDDKRKCVLKIALDAYGKTSQSAYMFFEEIVHSLKNYTGTLEKLQRLQEFFKPEKLGKFAEDKIFVSIRSEIENAKLEHTIKRKRKIQTSGISAARSASSERESQPQDVNKEKKARPTTEDNSVKENVFRMQ